jgi:hypothetical protein
MSDADNKLTLDAKGLNLELEGEASEVKRAYRALRPQLIEQFYDTMLSGQRKRSDGTLDLEAVDQTVEQSREEFLDEARDDQFLSVIVCEDIYRKMYLLDEKGFRDSFLSLSLRGEPLSRIYVSAECELKLRDNVELGSTLWRELTRAGKVAVGRSD